MALKLFATKKEEIMRQFQQLKHLKKDYYINSLKNSYYDKKQFANLKELEPFKNMEKTLMEGKPAPNLSEEYTYLEYYSFLFRLIAQTETPFKLPPIMRSISFYHLSVFYFFLQEILLKNSSKFEPSPLKNLIETLANDQVDQINQIKE
ncbi:MAG: hypothetical protein ABIM30_01280 [candidate division WOR-3 bacterium]